MIEYDENKHWYYLDGKRIPSVTQILSFLNDYSFVNQERIEYSRNFGTGVHLACELIDTDNLAELPEIYNPYVNSWNKFVEDFKPNIIEVEKLVYSEKYRFAGKADRIMKIGNKLIVADIKSGAKNPVHALQLAGYEIALKEMGYKINSRMAIYLKENNYYLQEFRDIYDTTIFLSALNIYNWKINNNIRSKNDE